jgi:hypothetical protein
VCCDLVVLRCWASGDFETTGRCSDTRLRRGRGNGVLDRSLPFFAHVSLFWGVVRPRERGTGDLGTVPMWVLHGSIASLSWVVWTRVV